jgi:anti-anti-sigma factor
MPLTLKPRFVGNVYIIHCAGRIVLGPETKALEAALDMASHEFSRFVLCLSELERLDSIGLGLLVRFAAHLRKRGGDIRLAAPPDFLVKLLELTMISSSLRCFATEEEAILSFLRQPPAADAPAPRGPRVLVVDESADLCVFVRTVLARHGFDVQSAGLVRDARVFLQAGHVDYVLVGPSTSFLPAESALKTLTPLAPKATALRLADDFKVRDAADATDALLVLFNLQRTP